MGPTLQPSCLALAETLALCGVMRLKSILPSHPEELRESFLCLYCLQVQGIHGHPEGRNENHRAWCQQKTWYPRDKQREWAWEKQLTSLKPCWVPRPLCWSPCLPSPSLLPPHSLLPLPKLIWSNSSLPHPHHCRHKESK